MLSARIQRPALALLTLLLVTIAVAAPTVAFFFPLEIETRESTVWLHVLALKQGINLYDHARVAFVNMNHGPLDPVWKLAIATVFPFLDAWQVTRFAVFALPFAFLLAAWALTTPRSPEARMRALCLGGMGYVTLMISAKETIFVGRSDATAALLVVILVYVSVAFPPKSARATALHGLVWGALGTSVILTNWRIAPNVAALLLFTLWLHRHVTRASGRRTGLYVASCAAAGAAIALSLLYYTFHFDLALYGAHFFGFHSRAAGWVSEFPPGSLGARVPFGDTFDKSPVSFVLDIVDPVGFGRRPYTGSPLLLASVMYALVPAKGQVLNRAWAAVAGLVFLSCALAYYMNYYGGGAYYFIPFVIVVWFLVCTNHQALSGAKLLILGAVILALMAANLRPVVYPTLKRLVRMPQAYRFLGQVRSLQAEHTVLSEDVFFYRTAYQGELIDMGDVVSVFRKTGYYGKAFTETATRHFAGLQSHPPEYVVTGFTESPELKALIEAKYVLVSEGPMNLTANYGQSTRLFRRKDLPPP
jgi:hypothetical protein